MFSAFKGSRLVRAASLALGAVIIGGVAVVATASAAAMIGFRPATSAQADEPALMAAEARVSSQVCSEFMPHFAVEIGKTQAEINAAFQRAIADTLADEVKAGRLTQAQADTIKQRLANRTPCSFGGLQPGGAKLEAFMQQYVAAAAAALGMSEVQLKTDLRSGQSLSQVAAASQPVLIQVAQETAMKDMTSRFQAMSERLMSDPEIRRSAEQMQEKLMSDPETRQLLEELMRRLGGGAPPPEELS